MSHRFRQLCPCLFQALYLLLDGCQLSLNALQIPDVLTELLVFCGDPPMLRAELIKVILEAGRLLAKEVLFGT